MGRLKEKLVEGQQDSGLVLDILSLRHTSGMASEQLNMSLKFRREVQSRNRNMKVVKM